jgi:hypothetical protein
MKVNIICYCLVQNPGTFEYDPCIIVTSGLEAPGLKLDNLKHNIQCLG